MLFATDFNRLGASPWISIYEFIACGHCNSWTVSLAHNLNQMLKLEYLVEEKKAYYVSNTQMALQLRFCISFG